MQYLQPMSSWNYLFLALWVISSISQAADTISELVLDNGLKVVVKPDHRSPVAAFQIWYKVGSANEQAGMTGISHMLEHLMFKRNKNVVLGNAFKRLNDIGAKGNAYTNRDHTFYYHTLGEQHLELAFIVEAERMQNLSPSLNEFNIEKKIIREEWFTRMSRDPYLPSYDALYEQAFKNGYQYPVSGRPEDLAALTLAQTMNWHRDYYTPDNAAIVVVGDINALNVFELARKYFSSIRKSKKMHDRYFPVHEKQTKEKRFVMPETTKVGMIQLAFKVPSIKTSMPVWEAYALEVLAGWFDSGSNSRLTGSLIRDKQLAHEVSVVYTPITRQDTLFSIEATPARHISLLQLEQALLEEIRQIKNELISEQTLQKIKNQMIAVEIFERDSLYTQAKIIGQAESVGIHWSEDAQYMSRIKAVTAEQVKRVLHKYFIPVNKTVVIQNSYLAQKN